MCHFNTTTGSKDSGGRGSGSKGSGTCSKVWW